ncbi:hypothetical protein AVEN_33784-1, partial [Araneus ventricosus]
GGFKLSNRNQIRFYKKEEDHDISAPFQITYSQMFFVHLYASPVVAFITIM